MKIEVYSKPDCHLCDEVKDLLIRHGFEFQEIDITSNHRIFERFKYQIPVVIIDGDVMVEMTKDKLETVLGQS